MWDLATAIKRRSEVAAAQDEAGAKPVQAVLVMVTDLRGDLERETARTDELQKQWDTLEGQLAAADSHRRQLEGQIRVLTVEAQQESRVRIAAEGRAKALADELSEIRRAVTGGQSKITLPPPR